MTVLLAGGCICVQSEEERTDLSAAVARMRVNWVHFTPSVAKSLNPLDLPSIKVVFVGGELVSEKDLEAWKRNTDLYVSYGPAEASVFCMRSQKVSITGSGRNIGMPFGCRSWIVERDNHQNLTPIGAIGELLLEGPIVARSCPYFLQFFSCYL